MEPTNLSGELEERPEYTALLHRLGVGEWTLIFLSTYFKHVPLEIYNDHLGKADEKIDILRSCFLNWL